MDSAQDFCISDAPAIPCRQALYSMVGHRGDKDPQNVPVGEEKKVAGQPQDAQCTPGLAPVRRCSPSGDCGQHLDLLCRSGYHSP
jgi:hypothetical protein